MQNKTTAGFQMYFAVAVLVSLSTLFVSSARAQCSDPGLKFAGELGVEGSFNNNGNRTQEVSLPVGAVNIDTTFHQTSLKAFGGGSDARSPLQASQIPAGICIVATGTEDHEKGWAVHSPYFHVVADDGVRVTQRAFGMTLYCTVGSNELDRTVGGCNAKVQVYYKLK
jgi:hypothetical protein